METIHERIKHIIKAEGISISKFEREIGVGYNSLATTLRRQASVSHTVLQGIASKYPKYSLSWLVLGVEESPKEQMLNRVVKALEGF